MVTRYCFQPVGKPFFKPFLGRSRAPLPFRLRTHALASQTLGTSEETSNLLCRDRKPTSRVEWRAQRGAQRTTAPVLFFPLCPLCLCGLTFLRSGYLEACVPHAVRRLNGGDPRPPLYIRSSRARRSAFFRGLTTARFINAGRKKSRATAWICALVTRVRRRLISPGGTTWP